jgi:regulator of protease activity HflC (stomatin/prohibitin superfamily)
MQVFEQLARLCVRVAEAVVVALSALLRAIGRARLALVVAAVLGTLTYSAWRHPPVASVAPGEIGIRSNRLTGTIVEFREGPALVVPGLHQLRRHSLRDRVFRPADSGQASGAAPFQSIEGLSMGVDLSVRYALDPTRLASIAAQLPDDIDGEVVQPAVQGVAYNLFPRYTAREIFSTKRGEIQEALAAALKPRLARDGILLRSVQMGKVDLPADYRAGMEQLLAEELQSEKMKYTLALKEQQVRESELEAEAAKVRREKNAQAAASEQVIAARAQEDAMRHVLPFKQKQIEQRKLEAEADKLARISRAQAEAEARRIEAAGEADSRQKLADAETYRLENIGKVTSAQMERDGALLSKHPLLIQKTMADKLSDKVSVIIAAPPTGGGFIGANLLGQPATAGE